MTHIFATRLHRLRLESGLSQKELALNLKVSPGTLSNYETGIYLPPLKKTAQLAAKLHTSMDYLCGLSSDNLDLALLNKKAIGNATYYQLTKYLATLSAAEREELLLYCNFLEFRRQHSLPYEEKSKTNLPAKKTTGKHNLIKYDNEPAVYKVAEEKP